MDDFAYSFRSRKTEFFNDPRALQQNDYANILSSMKYSLLIPTRNGAQYLPYAVQSILNQDYADCEVIVSVNHSTDDSLEVLRRFNDPRLKVIIPPKPLSMAKNFEWLLQHAQGEWVAYIGDDDGVMPYFFEEVEQILMRWPDIESIVSQGAYYKWAPPQVNYNMTRIERKINSKHWLFSMLLGIRKFPDLPSLYAVSVTRMSLIRKILDRSPAGFFLDLAPDVYSGVAIATTLSHFLHTGTPLFWRGTSSKSVGVSHTLSAYGTASEEMVRRAQEFEEMSQRDDVTLAKGILPDLWVYSISPYLIYAALRRLPFKVPFFQSRWAEYLAYTSVLRRIRQLDHQGEEEMARRLEGVYRKQLENKRVSPSFIVCVAWVQEHLIVPFKCIFRWERSLRKRWCKPAKASLVSKEAHLFQI